MAGSKLRYFRYTVEGRADFFDFELTKLAQGWVCAASHCDRFCDFVDESFASSVDDALLRADAIHWKRSYLLPSDVRIVGGGGWALEFVYSDGIRHRRRGDYLAEGPNHFEDFESFLYGLEPLKKAQLL